jgi:rhodanese-related sulfurtransferase
MTISKSKKQKVYFPFSQLQFKPKSTARDLKARLDFGRPCLTVIDIRDRDAYNTERIAGAIPVNLHQLPGLIKPILELDRDIYVYGESEQDTSLAAQRLRQAGFVRISELQGGLEAWKAIGGSTEGQNSAPTDLT